MILLDTCTFLWLASDKSKLSSAAGDSIRASGEFVDVSAITAWEIAWKHAKGQLGLILRQVHRRRSRGIQAAHDRRETNWRRRETKSRRGISQFPHHQKSR